MSRVCTFYYCIGLVAEPCISRINSQQQTARTTRAVCCCVQATKIKRLLDCRKRAA